ncbi:hypothetical protein [uncultured Pseudodesulfovibrio sp.]|uniref:hypothetical protein n=1 Tax=uncultured Pseudodesulfovibrio sp. TaxID=2035858 RepID=UPI0029C850F8|nr:hypothetical protein [uncultured Pseudodesulfovibrio sp.]
MRGSIKRQCGAALETITRIAQSRHVAKATGEAGIFSAATRNVVGQRLFPLQKFCKGSRIKNIEKLSPEDMEKYLQTRLQHHMAKGNSLHTFRAELSAVGKLEQGLNLFSELHRGGKNHYDWSRIRKDVSKVAGEVLSRTTSTYRDRAYDRPETIVVAIANQTHQLQARIQLEAGCRTEGVGAPSKGEHGKASNPMTKANWHHPETKRPLGLVRDPITGQQVAAFWTKEKGGKVAFHFCSSQTRSAVFEHFKANGRLESNYKEYLESINQAAMEVGQYHQGRGTHGLRHNFAQNRFDQALRRGYTDEQAKYAVSQEMSHNRADITETYLR